MPGRNHGHSPTVLRSAQSGQKVFQRAAARDGLGTLGDDVRARPRLLVAALDEQPLRLLPGARALQREPAAQLLAVQDEDGVPTLDGLRPCDASSLLVVA